MSGEELGLCIKCGKRMPEGEEHTHGVEDWSDENVIASRTVRVAMSTVPGKSPERKDLPSKTFVLLDLMLGVDTCVRHGLLADVARKLGARLTMLAELAEKVDSGDISKEEAVRIIAGDVS